VPVAILLGMVGRNLVLPRLASERTMQVLEPGLKFCTTTVLRGGIVCVGAKLSAVDVATLGVVGLPLVAGSVTHSGPASTCNVRISAWQIYAVASSFSRFVFLSPHERHA
jgi:hypothetical protein